MAGTVADGRKLAEILPERLRARLDATGKSMRQLSLAIGAHAGYVRDLFDADRFNVPSATRLQAMARELDSSVDYLLGEADTPGQVVSEVGVADRRVDWRGPPEEGPGIPLVGTGDCADLAVCDESGNLVEVERSTFDPEFHVRYIRRPPALRGARDIYAIDFHGSSMEPRFEAGEVGLVDPGRPVRPGDYVLVQLREAPGSNHVGSVLAKRLVRQTAREYTLEQFNPPLTFTLPRDQVVRIHRIMRQADLLFG